MKSRFKEITLEIYTDNIGRVSVRLDNTLNNQYINIITTKDEILALSLYQDLYKVLDKYEEK